LCPSSFKIGKGKWEENGIVSDDSGEYGEKSWPSDRFCMAGEGMADEKEGEPRAWEVDGLLIFIP